MKSDERTCIENGRNIKAVFFDVDQTLFSHRDRKIPDTALQALRILKERGRYVCISTGRHLLELDVLPADEFRYDAYNILNGQMCLDEERRPFFELPLTGRGREELLSLFEEKKVPVILVGREKLYINFENDYVRDILKKVPAQRPVPGEFDGGELFMGCVFGPRQMDPYFRERFEGLTLTRWHENAADVIPAGEGKVRGIRRIMERFGLERNEIMAFGDEENDIGMLSFAGIGVAMGNAGAAVRAAADYVTTGVDENGVRNALEHFSLV